MAHRTVSLLFPLSFLLPLAFCPLPLTGKQAQGPPPAPGNRGPSDPAELEAFVDGLMYGALKEYNTAGGVVAVVRGGDVFFAKGYGFADWEARVPVDPETTLFRIGSVSKLFVWTSVMQMVEEGRLDLEADVNGYLDFEIPPTFPEPVTLADIMAHSAGFEDYVLELFGDEPEDVRPLGELLARQIPARVRPPGELSSYSNHATGMAAYVVERVSGTEWKEHVETRILGPLGMRHTTFRQPLPDDLAPFMSKGYSYGGGRFREQDFEYVPLAPVGAGAASAADMARFMVAHLHLGSYSGGRILSEETARLMQTVQYRMDPSANGMALGFADLSQNGERIIGHGGDTRFFHTGLWLFPEHDLGVYVSFNSSAGGGARSRFFTGFMDRYFPVAEAGTTAPEDSGRRGRRFAGRYRSVRFSHTTFTKLGAVETQSVDVTGRGTLRALDADWIEVAPLTFQEEHGGRWLVFREDGEGHVTHFFVSTSPYAAFERVPLAENPVLHLFLFGLAAASMLVTLISPLVGWGIRRWHPIEAGAMVRIPRGARRAAFTAALLFAVWTVLILALVATDQVAVSLPAGLGFIFLLPILAILPALAMVIFAIRMWREKEGRPTVRVLYSLATVAFCLFFWQLSTWNLLGWHY